MNIPTFPSFTEAYYHVVHQVMENHQYESSPRGSKIKENIALSFSITDPRNRLLYIPERDFSLSYCMAEMLWYLSGSNSTEWIANYSTFWKNISDDGTTANSAYGARLFRQHPKIAQGRFTQWEYIKEELRKDPDSRRAVMHIRVPDDSIDAKLDVPCTLSLQFFIRDNLLHLVVHMRSNDVVLGLSFDVPAFTMMQELMALELGLELGTYTHIANSMHVYERHFEMCNSIMNGFHTSFRDAFEHGKIRPMPVMTSPPTEELVSYEEQLRAAGDLDQISRIIDESSNKLDFYWSDWVKILSAHRIKKLKFESISPFSETNFLGYNEFSK